MNHMQHIGQFWEDFIANLLSMGITLCTCTLIAQSTFMISERDMNLFLSYFPANLTFILFSCFINFKLKVFRYYYVRKWTPFSDGRVTPPHFNQTELLRKIFSYKSFSKSFSLTTKILRITDHKEEAPGKIKRYSHRLKKKKEGIQYPGDSMSVDLYLGIYTVMKVCRRRS